MDVKSAARDGQVRRFGSSPTKTIEATVLFTIENWQLAKIETDDGFQYCVVEQTAGVPWNRLQAGARVRCVVTTDLPRVVEVLQQAS